MTDKQIANLVTAAALAELTSEERAELIAQLSPDEVRKLDCCWPFWRSDLQGVPEGQWRVWMIMAGRGFGKTRVGAEWVRSLAKANPMIRIALVGATLAEARAVMIEGESGLLSVSAAHEIADWKPSRGILRWRSGAQARLYSADNPESLRGAQHHFAWCDELAKWRRAQKTWDNLQLGLRLGACPRVLITTTPRPVAIIRALVRQDDVVTARGGTHDNGYLPDAFKAAVTALYDGTRLGRQELGGELIEEAQGALWSRSMIEAARVETLPPVRRMVVAVDPPASVGGDACGIVAVALGDDGFAYLVDDASVVGATPERWARAVADCAARNGADKVVAEANNGGKMVETVLRGAAINMAVKLVHATHGKVARAEPVAALYESGRMFHAGSFPTLEDELCGLVVGGTYVGPGRSPDRADALVWAATELMLGKRSGDAPRIRGF
jgi:phage terminase large subunit-like protein